MGKRGRTRKHKYNQIAETLKWFEQKKTQYFKLRDEYKLLKLIIFNLMRISWHRLETIYWRRDRETNKIIEKKTRDAGLTYRKVGKDKHDIEYDLGESFIIDLDHKPPRLRILLNNKKRRDIPLECPYCGEFENRIFIEELPSDSQTDTGFKKYLDCPSGHFGWNLQNVKFALSELGLIH